MMTTMVSTIFRQIMAVTLKEFNVLGHDREALALLFMMPVFFIFLMSLALEGIFETGTSARPLKILIVNEDRGLEAQKTIDALKKLEGIEMVFSFSGKPLTRQKAEELITNGEAVLALHLREPFSEHMQSGHDGVDDKKAAISLIADPSLNFHLLGSVKGTIQGIVDRQTLVYSLPRLIANSAPAGIHHNPPETLATQDAMSSRIEELLANVSPDVFDRSPLTVTITTLRDGKNVKQPTATEQNVPGYTIFGVFFIVLTLASSFIQEKYDGTFQRILSAPLLKTALLVGKLLPYYLINLIQIGLMFAIGVLFFGLHLGNITALLLVSLALAAAANGLGLLVAAIGKTEAQVNGLAVLLAIILSALGGMMVPVFVMPDAMQTLAYFTPHAWALAGYHDVIIRGMGTREVLGEVGVLLGFAGLFFGVALWRFRFD